MTTINTCLQPESSAIQLSIDAINNSIAKLGVELSQIQQRQENLVMNERTVIECQLKFESKNLQVSIFLKALKTLLLQDYLFKTFIDHSVHN